MPYIDMNDYNNATAKQGGGGGIEQMLPSVQKLMVQAVRTQWTKKDGTVTNGLANPQKGTIALVYDISEGDFAMKYSDAYFMDWEGRPDPDKDYMHREFLSWSNLDYFKGKAEVLKACNPGFDPVAAINGGQFDMFVGKEFYAIIDGTVTLNTKGYDKWTYEVGEWLTPEQVRTGEHREPKTTDNRMKNGGVTSRPASLGSGNLNV